MTLVSPAVRARADRLARALLVLAAFGLAPFAGAQSIEVIKWPGDVVSGGGGNFTARPGDIIRWGVTLDNTLGVSDAAFDYLDVMDPLGLTSCGGSAPCMAAQHLQLLCDAPDAPDTDGGLLAACDSGLGRLDIRNIPVPAGSRSCVRFSTLILPTAPLAGMVQNVGCWDLLLPITQSGVTSPTTEANPACGIPLASDPPGCAPVIILSLPEPDFAAIKTVAHDDADADGMVEIGERLTWRVELINAAPDPHEGWVFDLIPAGTTFVDILANPDAACSLVGDEIQCPALAFAAGETKILEFRTELACSAATDDDSYEACNQAFICLDAARSACFPSDADAANPITPTCLQMPFSDISASTKAWRFTDADGDGSLSPGDPITFVLSVVNEGRIPATGVTLTDVVDAACLDVATLDPGTGTFDAGTNTLTFDLGDLAPGASGEAFFTAVALAGPRCCNQASVQSEERAACGAAALLSDDPLTPAADDPTCAQFGPQPLVRATKAWTLTNDVDADGVVDDGDEIEFAIVVTNEGAGPAVALRLEDPLLPCWEGFDPAALIIEGGGVNESVPAAPPATFGEVIVSGLGGADGLTSAPPETVTVRFRVTLRELPAGGGCCNQARLVLSESPLPVMSDDPVTAFRGDTTCSEPLLQTATLLVDKSVAAQDADACYEPGESVTFSIEVIVRDENGRDIQLIDAIDDPDGALVVLDPGTGSYDPASDEITWILGSMLEDEQRLLQWIGRVPCDAVDGATAADIATAAARNAPASSDGASVSVSRAILGLSRLLDADPSGNGRLDVGEIVTVTLSVQNTGSCASDSVVVSDLLDADLDEGALLLSAGGAFDGGTRRMRWDELTTPELASLAPGEIVVLTWSAPALDPAGNPEPNRDGIVHVEGAASLAGSFGCPQLAAAAPSDIAIFVVAAYLEVSERAFDQDGDGCFEQGELIDFELSVTARGSGGDGGLLVETMDDPSDVLKVVDAGTALLDTGAGTLTWTLGLLPVDVPTILRWQGRVNCDAADLTAFTEHVDAASGAFPPAAATLDAVVNTAVLALEVSLDWVDDGNAAINPGEVAKYSVSVTNSGSCSARAVSVSNWVDPDLDWSLVATSHASSHDGAGTWSFDPLQVDPLAEILPGTSVVLTLQAPALDPQTNPDPAHDGFLQDFANLSLPLFGDCAPLFLDAAGPEAEIGVIVGAVRLLRNDKITCLRDAFATARSVLRPRPVPQECSEPTAIDPDAVTTQVAADATSPWTFSGDADPAASSEECPQGPVGFGRILVFYELDEAPPGCLTTLRVAKSGGDVVVSW